MDELPSIPEELSEDTEDDAAKEVKTSHDPHGGLGDVYPFRQVLGKSGFIGS